MSRTIESSGAALAALCVAGMSSQAGAATVVMPIFVAHDSNTSTNIAVDSSTPQFTYNSYLDTFPTGDDTTTSIQKANFGTQNSGLIATSGNGGSPTVDPTLTYVPNNVQVSKYDSLQGSGYVQLAFLNQSGIQEFGFASFNEFGDLVSITYETADPSAVPLPASWALFTGGAGMLGMVAQRRRRRRKQAA